MTLQPKRKMNITLEFFKDKGSQLGKYPLIKATFEDNTKVATEIIKTDPDQINLQDPFASLTALHIAVMRQNVILVETLAKHPVSNLQLKDNFGRRAADMLRYTTNQQIFVAVLDATYPEETRELMDGVYEQAKNDDVIVPFKPKGSTES